ncbi:hypothetical protein [Methylotuvimicrobium buryatense]|nr:hypothetical protein [Methylotuvimicrobium buryatense]
MIELEITETVLTKNTEECLSAVHQLKQLSVKFTVDTLKNRSGIRK